MNNVTFASYSPRWRRGALLAPVIVLSAGGIVTIDSLVFLQPLLKLGFSFSPTVYLHSYLAICVDSSQF